MKNSNKLLLALALIASSFTTHAQVGIGTNAPNASLHVKNVTSETDVLKIQGSDTNTKLLVKENGKIIITTPATDNTVVKVVGITPVDNSLVLLDKKDPTGLERLNEGNGNGWRLIGRNAANYGNVGVGAVDFSESSTASSTKGASAAYSLIGPGLDNTIASNPDPLNSVILGGNNNTISNSSNFNDLGVCIIGGDGNTAHYSSGRSLLFGDNNTLHDNAFGIVLGTNNAIGSTTGSTSYGWVFGQSNVIDDGASGNIFGYSNNSKSPYASNIFGNGNVTQIPYETILGDYAELQTSTQPLATQIVDSYFTTTTDVSFRVGIGYRLSSNAIVRKDGFRVYKNGKVEVRQTPATNNALTKIYAREADGSFALVDKTSFVSDSFVEDPSAAGVFNLAYLNATYSSKPAGYRVYSKNTNKIYTKVAANRWVSEVVTDVL